MHPKNERWWVLAQRDVVAIDDPYSEGLVILRRSRAQFLRLLMRGCWEAVRIRWSHRRIVQTWQEQFTRLTDREQWLRYLGLGIPAAPMEGTGLSPNRLPVSDADALGHSRLAG